MRARRTRLERLEEAARKLPPPPPEPTKLGRQLQAINADLAKAGLPTGDATAASRRNFVRSLLEESLRFLSKW